MMEMFSEFFQFDFMRRAFGALILYGGVRAVLAL